MACPWGTGTGTDAGSRAAHRQWHGGAGWQLARADKAATAASSSSVVISVRPLRLGGREVASDTIPSQPQREPGGLGRSSSVLSVCHFCGLSVPHLETQADERWLRLSHSEQNPFVRLTVVPICLGTTAISWDAEDLPKPKLWRKQLLLNLRCLWAQTHNRIPALPDTGL